MGRLRVSGINGWALTVLVSFVLVGCGGDGSGNSAPVTSVQLSGIVVDGPVVAGNVRVTDADGTLLGQTTTDGAARFALEVPVEEATFPLTIVVTGGTNLVTGAPPEVALASFVNGPWENVTANVTPFSTLVVGVAERLPDGMTVANVGVANQLVREAMSFGLDASDFDQVVVVPIIDGTLPKYLKASESLAEMLRRTTDELMTTGQVASATQVLEALQADLVDGVVDGLGAPGADDRTAAISHVVTAQVLLESITNTLQVNGTDAGNLLDGALQQALTVPDPALTMDSVMVSAAALEQTSDAVFAAMAVEDDPMLATISDRLTDISPNTSPDTVAAMLPIDSGTALEPTIAFVRTADAEDLEKVNKRPRGKAKGQNGDPVIIGAPAGQVTAGELYSFVPSASDPEGDALTFSIQGKPAWATFDSNTGRLQGTPDGGDVGTFSNIQIAVTDGRESTPMPPFNITVSTMPNQAPTISGTPAAQVTVGNAYSFTPTAADPDGDTLSFSIQGRPSWATFNSNTGRLNGTPGAGNATTFSNIRITVTDGSDSRTLSAFAITVNGLPNQAPTISGTPATQVTVGNAYSFTPNAADPDGDALSFSIQGRPSWATFNSNTGRLNGTPGAGNATTFSNIRITVTDGSDSRTLPAFAITVNDLPNQAPTISGTPATQVTVGNAYSFTPNAADPDGDALSFSIQGRPSWAQFSTSTGRLNGAPGVGDVATYSNIRITVTDGSDSRTLSAFAITVNGLPNQAPTISGTPATQVTVGNAYSFTPNAADPDGDALSFSIQGRPSWATFNSNTGRLNGTPGAGNATTFSNIRITVTDGSDSRTLPAFAITVNDLPNQAPTISGTPATQVTVGNAYSFTPNAADPDGDALSFSIQGRPSWAQFSTSTGRLNGAPGVGDVATYSNIRITVTDGSDSRTLSAFAISVDAAAAQTVFHQSPTGLLVMEAERFDLNVGSNGVAPWIVIDEPNASNTQALKSPGGSTTDAPNSPRSEYGAKFVVGGTHYVWVRFRAFGTGSDSLYIEVDNLGPQRLDTQPVSGNWEWARLTYASQITAGEHSVKVYRRESNFEVDRIVLTTNGTFTPTGQGPAESQRATSDVNLPPPPNQPPSISGVAATQVLTGQAYSFTPTASDPDSDPMSFGIQGRPAWATFNSANGRLEGTPSQGDVGTYGNIRISVTDGEDSAQLAAFTIEVLATATGGFTLMWDAPQTNVDGSPLTDLAGYKIYLGTESGNYGPAIEINNPGVTTYVFDQLAPGTYYLTITSVDVNGNEGPPSQEASATI